MKNDNTKARETLNLYKQRQEDFMPSDSESDVDEGAQPGPDGPGGWPAWNRLQGRNACRFAADRRLQEWAMVVTLRSLGPLVTLLREIER